MPPLTTYIATDFRRRFGEMLPAPSGGLASDLRDLAEWCEGAVAPVVAESMDAEAVNDVHLVVAQIAVVNRFLVDQGFSPPDPMRTFARDPLGTLLAVAEYYRRAAPLVAEPNQRLN